VWKQELKFDGDFFAQNVDVVQPGSLFILCLQQLMDLLLLCLLLFFRQEGVAMSTAKAILM
jgi:hypothetical protein